MPGNDHRRNTPFENNSITTMDQIALSELLNSRAEQYNSSAFIATDPISIPHQFNQKEDIEISAFLTATISWGQRSTIIQNARRLMKLMDSEPSAFLQGASELEFGRFSKFVHRTFNGDDTLFLVSSLRTFYRDNGGLEEAFLSGYRSEHSIRDSIQQFRTSLFDQPHLKRSEKHIANPSAGSACKRINMFLRWMVRKDQKGVDFGIWKFINPSDLQCPLDVHSGRVARKLGLLNRKQDDWKSVEELTDELRTFDPEDPVKYDFALFGLGVFEKY